MKEISIYSRSLSRNIISSSLALLVAIAISTVIILIVGKDPVGVYAIFLRETIGNPYGIGQVLFKATPLMFTGLAAGLCFKAGLFNIGGEGQLIIGAFCTAVAGFIFGPLPPFLLIPICLLAGIVGGGIWGVIPGILKAAFGAHEVINTIMMNFIAAGIVNYLVSNVFFVPATVHTPEIHVNAEIPRLESFIPYFHGSPVNLSILIALLTCILLQFYLFRTTKGYETRATGLNVEASRYAGIQTSKVMIMTFFLSGGLAGLVGSNYILGYKHYFELGFSEGIGFIGIAVALLARNNPIAIIFTAIFFGILEYGSLTINTIVPKELANILQAVVILSIITLTKVFDKYQLRLVKTSS
jgi:ABC-type uncharacterized transport system permease subunit